jgi:hypothetical protein
MADCKELAGQFDATGMDERLNDAAREWNTFNVPVSWQSSDPFYPQITFSNNSEEMGANQANLAATQRLPRPVIVLTALLMALIYLTGKPCLLQSAAGPSPRPERHGESGL